MSVLQIIFLFLFGFGTILLAVPKAGGSPIAAQEGTTNPVPQAPEGSSTSTSAPSTTPTTVPSKNVGLDEATIAKSTPKTTDAGINTSTTESVPGSTTQKTTAKNVTPVNEPTAKDATSYAVIIAANHNFDRAFSIVIVNRTVVSELLETNCLMEKMQEIIFPCIDSMFDMHKNSSEVDQLKFKCNFEACVERNSNDTTVTDTSNCKFTLTQMFGQTPGCVSILGAASANKPSLPMSRSGGQRRVDTSGIIVNLVPVLFFPYLSVLALVARSLPVTSKLV